VEKYDAASQTTNDSIIQSMGFAFLINKPANTLSE
jgi:hypothetical protein